MSLLIRLRLSVLTGPAILARPPLHLGGENEDMSEVEVTVLGDADARTVEVLGQLLAQVSSGGLPLAAERVRDVALMTGLLDLAVSKGLEFVDLTSRPSREVANGLYQSLGFKLRETNCYRHLLRGVAP